MNLTIPGDKANHVAYGAAVAAVVSLLSPWAALGACVGVALGKELADWRANRAAKAAGLPPPHGVEALDALATVAGGLLVILPQLLSGR